MKLLVMTMSPVETPCTQHEEQIQENSREIAELKARADYKDKRIDELKKDMHEIKQSIDNLTATVNNSIVNSIKDDNDLREEVTKLKTKIETQENVLKQYKEEARKQRDEDRQKTNQYIAYVGIGLTILSLILAHFFK